MFPNAHEERKGVVESLILPSRGRQPQRFARSHGDQDGVEPVRREGRERHVLAEE